MRTVPPTSSRGDHEPTRMAMLQETPYARPEDFEHGAPHLTHPALRATANGMIREIVLERFDAVGHCQALEVGAGAGAFTDILLAAGAEVISTEMNHRAVNALAARFRHNHRATPLFDCDGEEIFRRAHHFDAVFCISVLHHIPDYLHYLERIIDRINPGGTLLSYQDPLYYPRRRRVNLLVDRAAFLAWRVRQGELRRGLATQIRRWRKVYDEHLASDMAEYHVVRDGVDELAISELLAGHFREVYLTSYWSTPSRTAQTLGDRLRIENTFAVRACGRVSG